MIDQLITVGLSNTCFALLLAIVAMLVGARAERPHLAHANSILTAFESLARPILRPPAMASEINSGGSLERRFSMMVSNSVDRSNSAWLQACVLLSAMVVLPFGVVYAQDYEAVGKRLRAAVQADEISGEQARIMLRALKRAEERGERTQKSITREDYAAAETKLKAMVAEGEVSEEDARARLGAMRRMMAEQHEGRGKSREVDWDAIQKRIEGAVQRGDLTRKKADAKYRKIIQRMKVRQREAGPRTRGERRITRKDYSQAEVDLRQAVSEGKISGKDARARLGAMRKAMADQGERDDERSRWEGIKKQIEGAVKSGDMTREEADAKYREIRERMGHKDKREKPDWDAIKRRIEGAVERGDLTREEADAKYREIKQRMSRDEEPDELDWDAVERRIEGAVKRGDMTREEADAKYRELRK